MISSITVEELKKLYPDPVATISHKTRLRLNEGGFCYCVGGALCNYVQRNFPKEAPDKGKRDWSRRAFPSRSRITPYLQRINKSLSEKKATLFAGQIINANDSGFFDLAWQYLHEALTYQPTELELQAEACQT